MRKPDRTRTAARPVVSWRNRQLPRYAANLRIKIVLPDTPPKTIHARTADLSTGGICVVLPQTVAEDALAVIGLRYSERGGEELTIWFRARLCHRSGFRRGYEFLDMSVEQKLVLRRLCLALVA
jgi:hypothetical protein